MYVHFEACQICLVFVHQLTCVGVGDVCNKGKVCQTCSTALSVQYSLQGSNVCVCCVHAQQNYVVAVGAEGWFHLFDLTSAAANKADSSSQHEFTLSEDQKPLFTQHIPANTKVILISDIGKAWRCNLTSEIKGFL